MVVVVGVGGGGFFSQLYNFFNWRISDSVRTAPPRGLLGFLMESMVFWPFLVKA